MKLKDYIEKYDIDTHMLAAELLICHGYLVNIINEFAKPSKRLAKMIEIVTGKKVLADEFHTVEKPLREKCKHCGSYIKAKRIIQK